MAVKILSILDTSLFFDMYIYWYIYKNFFFKPVLRKIESFARPGKCSAPFVTNGRCKRILIYIITVRRRTFAMATAGNASHSSCSSSPWLPRRCPLNIREAVSVAAPIPSPIRNTTFFALPGRPS